MMWPPARRPRWSPQTGTVLACELFAHRTFHRVSTVNADGLWEVTFLDTATGKPLALSGVPDGEV